MLSMYRYPNCDLHNSLAYKNFFARLDAHADRIQGAVHDLGRGDFPYRDLALRQSDSDLSTCRERVQLR